MIARCWLSSLTLGCVCLLVACLDWESLPRVGAGQDAGTDAATNELAAPLVEWVFSRYAGGGVPATSAPPGASAGLTPLPDSPRPQVVGDELWMQGTELRSSSEAAAAFGRAIADGGGGFSVELWYRLTGDLGIGERQWLCGLGEAPGSGFSVLLDEDSFLVNVSTTATLIDVLHPRPHDEERHQVVVTYRPGAASLVTLYVDGAAVRAASGERTEPGTTVEWPPGQGFLLFGDYGLRGLYLWSAAMFARELPADEVARRFVRGPAR